MTTRRFDSHAILVNHYAAAIRNWKWGSIVKDANDNIEPDEFGDMRGRAWLGSTMGLAPSGKVYAFWTTNQTSSDIRRDEAFWDAVEQVAEERGGYITFEDDSVFFDIEALDQPDDEMETIANGENYDSEI